MSLPDNKVLTGFVLVLAACLMLQWQQVGDGVERAILDWQFGYLRAKRPQPIGNDVVVVGIDDKAFAVLREPFALWHPHLGKFLQAMAAVKPSVVGLDITLPDRSYHFLIPQYDQPLLAGLAAVKEAKVPLAIARTLDENNNFRGVFAPYVSVAGTEAFGSGVVCTDADGIVRRYAEQCDNYPRLTPLAGRMAEFLGVKQEGEGVIDWAIGDAYDYLPFATVLAWYDAGDLQRLGAAFRGRPVLLGSVLPFADRHLLPVDIARWQPLRHRVPGVLIHAQTLRSMLTRGLERPAPAFMLYGLTALAALFWFGRGGWLKTLLLAGFVAGMLWWSTLLLWQTEYLPVAAILLCALLAFVARLLYQALLLVREKRFLRGVFSSYVSPQILREIITGHIQPGLGGTRRDLTVMFIDIRNFTSRSENMPPEQVVSLLNDYFSAMTAAIHRHGGTVDKFIGDGIMAFFGAPQPLECAQKNALEAAHEMLVRLDRLNAGLRAQDLAPIEIGVGIHCGEAVVGHVGSETRHEYTAIGDVVNTASRLQGLAKQLGYPVILSLPVADAVGRAGGLVDLGEHALRGRSAARVFGWNPSRLDAAAIAPETPAPAQA